MPELQSPGELSVNDILASLAVFDGKYKRAEVDAGIARREEVVPKLIEILEGVLAQPEKFAEDESYFAHTYALMLLGHFREPKAHQTIISLASLPRDLPYRLFGDTITEDLPVILLRTCNGSLEAIKGLVHNTEADEYCRGSAARAITYGVVDGLISREEVLSFLSRFFNEETADRTESFLSNIASCLCHLCPGELMEKIEAWYARDFIFPGYIELEEFRRALSRGREKCLSDLKTELEERSLDDIHRSMSWWACFQERRQPLPLEFVERKATKDNKKKKARRKMVEFSRRKNRRKKK